LLLGEAWGSPDPARSAQGGQAVVREVAEVGIHGVDVDLEQSSDRGGREIGGAEQEDFRATTLPRSQRFLQPLMDPAKFGRARLADVQGT
jgi:hypothetical protein